MTSAQGGPDDFRDVAQSPLGRLIAWWQWRHPVITLPKSAGVCPAARARRHVTYRDVPSFCLLCGGVTDA